jgi:hypothetical protein
MSSRAAKNSSLPHPLLVESRTQSPPLLSSQALSATRNEGTTNQKLTYALATLIFAVALVATPTKAHASFNSYLTIDGGGGNDCGSTGSSGSSSNQMTT